MNLFRNIAGALDSGTVPRTHLTVWRQRSLVACVTLTGSLLAAFLMPLASNGQAPSPTHSPSGRAYEMVSPPEKNGADIAASPKRTRAAADGGAVGFISLTAFGDALGTGVATDYVSRRTGRAGTNGWSTHAITPRQDTQSTFAAFTNQEPRYTGEFSEDLSRAVFRAWSPLGDEPEVKDVANLYRRDDVLVPGAGAYRLVSHAVAPVPVSQHNAPFLAGSSADLEVIAFESVRTLTPDAPANGSGKLYTWNRGKVSYVGVLPNDSCASPPCLAETSIAGVSAGTLPPPRYTPNVVSDDGTHVFFTVPVDHAGRGDLYARIDGERTVQLNASEPPGLDPTGPHPARYETATPDGQQVFLTTRERLVPSDTNNGGDLYAYDFDAAPGNRLTRLSVDQNLADAEGDLATDFRGSVLGTSDDGSYVYFVFPGNQLVPGKPAIGDEDALYVWHAGTLSYIGTLPTGDRHTNIAGSLYDNVTAYAARVTPSGRHLLFNSHSGAGLTGYDHGNACGVDSDGNSTEPCNELYLYRADDHALRCVSCKRSGAPATADATTYDAYGTGGATVDSHLNRPLSDDGRWVFFGSGDSLVPGDVNGQAIDVYEYDTASGALRLLTSGTDEYDSFFLDATKDGTNVFFVTRERLSGWDVDGNYDIYDARVDGGMPEPEAAGGSGDCAGDGCQGAMSSPAGSLSPPATSDVKRAIVGRSRPAHRKRCAKSRVRKRARGKIRCVKRHRQVRTRTERKRSGR
jgi:hypothetical protein